MLRHSLPMPLRWMPDLDPPKLLQSRPSARDYTRIMRSIWSKRLTMPHQLSKLPRKQNPRKVSILRGYKIENQEIQIVIDGLLTIQTQMNSTIRPIRQIYCLAIDPCRWFFHYSYGTIFLVCPRWQLIWSLFCRRSSWTTKEERVLRKISVSTPSWE